MDFLSSSSSSANASENITSLSGLLLSSSKILLYIKFTALFIVCNLLIIISAYITLPYKDLTMWETFKMAIPFAWLSRIFLTTALDIENKNKLFGSNNLVFFLIILQFLFTMLADRFYLKQKTSRSDYVAFFMLLIAYAISNNFLVSKALGIPVKDASGNIIAGPGAPSGSGLLDSLSNSGFGSGSATTTSLAKVVSTSASK